MSYLSLLTIRPLELLFETIFAIVNSYIGKPGITIIVLSILVNLLVLPLYERADEMQKAADEKQKKMEKWKKHINKTFKGDERMMMLQTYYRQNGYNPMSILLGSVPLLLQIPFFMAAYRFLSNLQLLNGCCFGPIADLGREDAMFMIGSFPVNVLPILMTGINIVAGLIYTKNQAWKNRIQMLLTALVFLVLLYRSPAGLVFYWTCNNVFSLLKNIVTKLIPLKKKKKENVPETEEEKKNSVLFILGSLYLILLTGGFITTNILKASPAEFVDIGSLSNPLRYAIYTLLYATGTFGVWFGIYYLLSGTKGKKIWQEGIWMFGGIATVNYLVAGTHLGTVSSLLQYAVKVEFGKKKNLLALLLCAFVVFLIHLLYKKKIIALKALACAAVTGLVILTVSNAVQIEKDYKTLDYLNSDGEAGMLKISKTGKNVVVLMMDRALGSELPYLMNEKPELKEQFDGFTYYRNTVSFGSYTNMGAPALYGGYEYTPERMNERKGEALVTKHDEALSVMPVLFNENGYSVTVCDPPYAGYQWIPDLSIYEEYPEIRAYITQAKFYGSAPEDATEKETGRRRNFFCHSIMKIAPLFLQNLLYNGGLYNEPSYNLSADGDERYVSGGYDLDFLDWYLVLCNMTKITEVEESSENNFLMLTNGTTHEECLLQKPDYVPKKYVDNTEYEKDADYTINGRTLRMTEVNQQKHYCVNMAAMLKIGEWLDFLRENDCYDNTRIIIVADHGRDVNHFDIVSEEGIDLELNCPLLMVKDFDAHGFEESEEFMTNADTPSIAVKGLIENPVNPFSGNTLDGHEKAEEPHLLFSEDWNVDNNNGEAFHPGMWYTVSGDIYDIGNWKYLGEY